MKIRLAALLAMLSCVASAATTPPKVVFIGDYITYNWTSGFAANPNWVNLGVQGVAFGGLDGAPDIAAAIKLHPAIIHILMGANISATTPASSEEGYAPPNFSTSLDAMVKQAQAANIKVILGITPGASAGLGSVDLEQFNAITAAYGAAHKIEVVNYGDALCECVGALGGNTETPNAFQQIIVIPSESGSKQPASPGLLPTAAGYAMMTQMAQTAIADEYLTIESGYLSNVQLPNDAIGNDGSIDVFGCGATCVLQFTPIGIYSDGSTHPQNNTSWGGNNGTWTSSDPLVMSVNQQGLAYALTVGGGTVGRSRGTAAIKYTPANGVDFHEWVMYIQ